MDDLLMKVCEKPIPEMHTLLGRPSPTINICRTEWSKMLPWTSAPTCKIRKIIFCPQALQTSQQLLSQHLFRDISGQHLIVLDTDGSWRHGEQSTYRSLTGHWTWAFVVWIGLSNSHSSQYWFWSMPEASPKWRRSLTPCLHLFCSLRAIRISLFSVFQRSSSQKGRDLQIRRWSWWGTGYDCINVIFCNKWWRFLQILRSNVIKNGWHDCLGQ